MTSAYSSMTNFYCYLLSPSLSTLTSSLSLPLHHCLSLSLSLSLSLCLFLSIMCMSIIETPLKPLSGVYSRFRCGCCKKRWLIKGLLTEQMCQQCGTLVHAYTRVRRKITLYFRNECMGKNLYGRLYARQRSTT